MRTFLAALAAAPLFMGAPALAATVTGTVVDAHTGEPVSDAFVRQEGSVASAFSGSDGRFSLRLDDGAGPRVAITKGGYALQAVSRERLAAGPVRLEPLAPYRAALPAPAAPRPASPWRARLMADYQLFLSDYASPGGSFGGLGANGLRLGGAGRHGAYFGLADLGRAQVPVEVAGLGPHENPAFSPETWEARAMAGYLFRWGDLELGPGLAYRLWRFDPHNRDVPYTNTPLDFRQTAHLLGLGLRAESPLPAGFELEGDARYYPFGLAFADPGDPVLATERGLQLSVILAREAMPGVFPGLGYRYAQWTAQGVSEQTHFVFGRLGFQPRLAD